MFCDSPAPTDATTKRSRAVWNISLRPAMSDSLPHSGVDAVIVSSAALATQESLSWPPRSPTIVGSAVATTDVDSIDVSIAIISPARISRI